MASTTRTPLDTTSACATTSDQPDAEIDADIDIDIDIDIARRPVSDWQAPDHGEPMDPNAQGPAAPGAAYPTGYASPPPGYLPPGYAPPGYAPPGYAYPAAPYPVGYAGYGYPQPAPGDARPGLATASAVLAFVVSGLLILAGLLLFLGGAIASDVEDSVNSSTHIGVELGLNGVVNLVAAGLLIAGGVTLVGRNRLGRVLLSIGGAIVVAAAVYWIVRFDDISSNSWNFDAGLFLVLVVLTLCFAWATPVTRWLARER